MTHHGASERRAEGMAAPSNGAKSASAVCRIGVVKMTRRPREHLNSHLCGGGDRKLIPSPFDIMDERHPHCLRARGSLTPHVAKTLAMACGLGIFSDGCLFPNSP